jgi:hypothetical protein
MATSIYLLQAEKGNGKLPFFVATEMENGNCFPWSAKDKQ